MAVLIVVLALIVALVVAFFVADAALRSYAQNRAEKQIEQELPSGVTGAVDVRIGGWSVIAQYLSGSFSAVRISAPQLSIHGAPVSIDATLNGVPRDLASPVQRVSATIDVPEASANALAKLPGAQSGLRFTEGHVGYVTALRPLGFVIEFSVSARPAVQSDGRVALTPTSVEFAHGSHAIQVLGLAKTLLANKPATICVAKYLPQKVSLTSVDVHSERVVLHLSAQNLPLTEAALRTTGSCSD